MNAGQLVMLGSSTPTTTADSPLLRLVAADSGGMVDTGAAGFADILRTVRQEGMGKLQPGSLLHVVQASTATPVGDVATVDIQCTPVKESVKKVTGVGMLTVPAMAEEPALPEMVVSVSREPVRDSRAPEREVLLPVREGRPVPEKTGEAPLEAVAVLSAGLGAVQSLVVPVPQAVQQQPVHMSERFPDQPEALQDVVSEMPVQNVQAPRVSEHRMSELHVAEQRVTSGQADLPDPLSGQPQQKPSNVAVPVGVVQQERSETLTVMHHPDRARSTAQQEVADVPQAPRASRTPETDRGVSEAVPAVMPEQPAGKTGRVTENLAHQEPRVVAAPVRKAVDATVSNPRLVERQVENLVVPQVAAVPVMVGERISPVDAPATVPYDSMQNAATVPDIVHQSAKNEEPSNVSPGAQGRTVTVEQPLVRTVEPPEYANPVSVRAVPVMAAKVEIVANQRQSVAGTALPDSGELLLRLQSAAGAVSLVPQAVSGESDPRMPNGTPAVTDVREVSRPEPSDGRNTPVESVVPRKTVVDGQPQHVGTDVFAAEMPVVPQRFAEEPVSDRSDAVVRPFVATPVVPSPSPTVERRAGAGNIPAPVSPVGTTARSVPAADGETFRQSIMTEAMPASTASIAASAPVVRTGKTHSLSQPVVQTVAERREGSADFPAPIRPTTSDEPVTIARPVEAVVVRKGVTVIPREPFRLETVATPDAGSTAPEAPAAEVVAVSGGSADVPEPASAGEVPRSAEPVTDAVRLVRNDHPQAPSAHVEKRSEPHVADRNVDAAESSGSRQVARQVSEQLSRHDLKAGSEQLVIRLTPESLGELKLNLNLQGQRLTVEIQTESHTVREAIVRHSDSLREALGRQNITMESFDVSTNSRGGDRSGQGQQDWRQAARERQQQFAWLGGGNYAAQQTQALAGMPVYQQPSQHAMVDIHY